MNTYPGGKRGPGREPPDYSAWNVTAWDHIHSEGFLDWIIAGLIEKLENGPNG